MAAAWFGTPGAEKTIEQVFGKGRMRLKWHCGSAHFRLPDDEKEGRRLQKSLCVVAHSRKRAAELVTTLARGFKLSDMRGFWMTVDHPPVPMRREPVEEGVWLSECNGCRVRRLL
jgi:hypothetical protein